MRNVHQTNVCCLKSVMFLQKTFKWSEEKFYIITSIQIQIDALKKWSEEEFGTLKFFKHNPCIKVWSVKAVCRAQAAPTVWHVFLFLVFVQQTLVPSFSFQRWFGLWRIFVEPKQHQHWISSLTAVCRTFNPSCSSTPFWVLMSILSKTKML